jgi:Gram-negative bacterial TonB protein C-terminal
MKTFIRWAALSFSLLVLTHIQPAHAQQETTVSDADIKVLAFESLNYPPLALQTNYQGLVVVRVRLDSDGNVTAATAISGHKLLIPDCLANVKKWRFQSNSSHSAVIVYNFRMPSAPNTRCKSAGSFFTLDAPNLATIISCGITVQP